MSQEDLALAAGVDRSYIGRIENCKRSPGLDILWKLSKGLNITLNELLKF